MNRMEDTEEFLDACCGVCGSMFHSTANHGPSIAARATTEGGFPPGYDPAEADRLIGRDPSHR